MIKDVDVAKVLQQVQLAERCLNHHVVLCAEGGPVVAVIVFFDPELHQGVGTMAGENALADEGRSQVLNERNDP